MGESTEKLVDIVQYPAGTMAALGYQVYSIVGKRVREALSLTSTPAGSDCPVKDSFAHSSTTQNVSVNDRRWLRKSSSAFVIEDLPVYTLQDVSFHDTYFDCWIVLYDRVYDITSFLKEHPGGDDVMLEYAGRDATLAFRSVGHSKMAEDSLEPFLVGILAEKERIWTRFFNMIADRTFD